MAETMKGLKRTHRCGELSSANIGETATVMGWVQKQRNKGGIIFVDLRDRAGILQVIFEESDCGSENFEKASKLRSEFVVAVVGRVEKRAVASNETWLPATSKYAPSRFVFYPRQKHRPSPWKQIPRPKKIYA